MIEAALEAAFVILLLYNGWCVVTLRYYTCLLPSQSLIRLPIGCLGITRCQLGLHVCRGIHFVHEYHSSSLLSYVQAFPSRLHIRKLMIVLFLDQDLWCNDDANSVGIRIVDIIAIVVVNQLYLLHHSWHIALLMSMVRRRFQYGRVLSSFLEQDIVLVATYLEILSLRGLYISVEGVRTEE